MSSSTSRLYRIFTTNPKPSKPPPRNTPITPKPTAPPPPPPPPEPIPLTFNTSLQSVFRERNLSKLVKIFKKASESPRFRSKHHVYDLTIRRLATAKKLDLVEDLLEHQKKYRDITKEGFAVRLISLYTKAGMFEHAHKLFDEMPQLKCPQTVMSFNALLTSCVHCKRFDKAEEIFRQVPSSVSITPDVRSYNIVIQALCEMGSLESAQLMLDEMESNGVKPTLVTFNTLMNGFYSNGNFEDGERIWEKMAESGIVLDTVSFNVKLGALVRKGMIAEAVELIEELKSRELEPDIITYNTLIKWYCSNGKLDEAKSLYDLLLKNGCVPNGVTFEALIPCIYEKGDIDLSLKLCMECVGSNCFISVELLQTVVDRLVKESRVVEAENLVKLAMSKRHGRSSLKMPSIDA